MMKGFEDFQKLGQSNIDATVKTMGEFQKGLQAIANEITDYNKKAIVEFGNESYAGCQIKNLSLTGMFIEGNFKPSRNKKCYINFVRDNNKLDVSFIEVLGEVVRENSEGLGIKITTMKFDHYMRLITELINIAENPVHILSEIPKWCPYEISEERLSILN